MNSLPRRVMLITNYNSLPTTCVLALKHYLTSLDSVIDAYGFKYTSIKDGFYIIFSPIIDQNHFPVLREKFKFCVYGIQFEEGVTKDYSEKDSQILSYFPDPMLRPTLCYTHEPTNTNISIIQTSLRELTQLQKPVKCLAVFTASIEVHRVKGSKNL